MNLLHIKYLPALLCVALFACATVQVESDYPFRRFQNLSNDEPCGIIRLSKNENVVQIIMIDGKSTRYDNVGHWNHDYYPNEIRVRPGKYMISFGVNGVVITEWNNELDIKAGNIYSFVVKLIDVKTSSNSSSNFSPIFEGIFPIIK